MRENRVLNYASEDNFKRLELVDDQLQKTKEIPIVIVRSFEISPVLST